MRLTFVPPSEEEFRRLFLSTPLRRGGGLEDISIFYPTRRRGGSVLSAISGVARRVLPFIFKALNPSAKEFGRAVLSDMITAERPLKESLKRHGIQAVKSTGLRLLKGSGKRRKSKKGRSLKVIRKTKKEFGGRQRLHKNDVYNLLHSLGRGTS